MKRGRCHEKNSNTGAFTVVLFFMVAEAFLLFACGSTNGSNGDTDSDSDTGTDTDTDADMDTDTDTSSDTIDEPCETRGTWMWASSIETDEKMASVFDKIAAANLNSVLMSAPPINENHGYGTPERFLEFITEAQSQGLNVQVWIANHRRLGSSYNAEFTDPDERAAQVQWVMDLMEEYGDHLDGMHLDYIRYETSTYELNEDGRMDAVTQTVQEIHEALETNYPGKSLTAAVFRVRPVGIEPYSETPEWVEDVPQWFRDWYADNPGSEYHGPEEVGVPYGMFWQQNSVEWLGDSIIEAVMPMQYSTWDDEWQETLERFVSFVDYVGSDPYLRVQMGLGWKPKSNPESHAGFDAPGVVRKIKYGRSLGMKGYYIFILANHEEDDTPLLEALSIDSEDNDYDAPFKSPIPICPIM